MEVVPVKCVAGSIAILMNEEIMGEVKELGRGERETDSLEDLVVNCVWTNRVLVLGDLRGS